MANPAVLQDNRSAYLKLAPKARAKTNSNALVLPIIFGASAIFYAYLFCSGLAPYWFNPEWTTDDALQQVYPFWEALYPERFKDDLITEVMVGYLTPIHYWLSFGITILTGDPIMMAHWMMLIQITLTLGFLFMAVRCSAGIVPAFFAVIWLLHTRHVMQRLTSGLVRGWAAPLMTAYLYFALSGNHWGVLATLVIGCAVHPPATMLLALGYGILLLFRSIRSESPELYRGQLKSLLLVAPLMATITLMVVSRPAHIGQMVSYNQAATMPEFSRPYGRFPFVPLNPAQQELRHVGLQAFIGRFYGPSPFWKSTMPYWVGGAFIAALAIGFWRKRTTIPLEVLSFGAASLIIYFAARALAFKLYVPDRHLQFPLAIFFVVAFSIGIWRAFQRTLQSTDSTIRNNWLSSLGLLAIGLLVYVGSNDGLSGAANFNYSRNKHGGVYSWLKDNTPGDAMIGGHPTHLDPVQLFGARRVYISTETSHPFYPRYNDIVRQRTELVLRAYFSSSLSELERILSSHQISYFLFRREDFYPYALAAAKFFPPYEELLKELTSRDYKDYAYRKLPSEVVVYKDKKSVVVDVKALRSYLERGLDETKKSK